VVIWPRLRPLLSPEAADRITAARTALDATVGLVGLAIAFGIVWPILLLVAGGHGGLAALCLLAWPVVWAAYTAGVQAAAAYGQEVRVVSIFTGTCCYVIWNSTYRAMLRRNASSGTISRSSTCATCHLSGSVRNLRGLNPSHCQSRVNASRLLEEGLLKKES
jgi:hypothetical protein